MNNETDVGEVEQVAIMKSVLRFLDDAINPESAQNVAARAEAKKLQLAKSIPSAPGRFFAITTTFGDWCEVAIEPDSLLYPTYEAAAEAGGPYANIVALESA
jgi:hypothetical protein